MALNGAFPVRIMLWISATVVGELDSWAVHSYQFSFVLYVVNALLVRANRQILIVAIINHFIDYTVNGKRKIHKLLLEKLLSLRVP